MYHIKEDLLEIACTEQLSQGCWYSYTGTKIESFEMIEVNRLAGQDHEKHKILQSSAETKPRKN